MMKWYHYLACFCAGLFLTNAVPHFMHGVSGDSFPSPFANPPGKGLSSPMVNVLWGLGNFVIGYLFLRVGKVSPTNRWGLAALFLGIVCISVLSSIVFADKMH
jgi:TRAP-type C4-dicarboxylate transport system permease large subunit